MKRLILLPVLPALLVLAGTVAPGPAEAQISRTVVTELFSSTT